MADREPGTPAGALWGGRFSGGPADALAGPARGEHDRGAGER